MIMTYKQRWLSLWKRIGAQGNAHVVYNDLVARYFEPNRAYHTLEHIGHCLDEFEQVRHLAMNPDTVELAIWYHDAVYDTRAKNNEEQSAALAVEAVRNVSLPDSFGQIVANLIMATKHLDIPVDSDTRLLVDIDLSILGQSEDEFDEYERRIRKEYEWVPEDEFAAGRSVVLKSLLNRPAIYSMQFFRDKYEAQARRNIARSLTRLRA
jgi:predicted metal-dependent HD superfamily phosphohydrolase